MDNNLPAIHDFNILDKDTFEAMQRLSIFYANSEIVPKMYQISTNNPEKKAVANCLVALEMSKRMDISPLMVMQNMVPIQGRPSWSAKFLIAKVNTCGRFNPLQYKIVDLGLVGQVEYTEFAGSYVNGAWKTVPVVKKFDGSQLHNLQCIAYASQKGSEEMLESSPVSITMAILEGWYTKSGSKWPTMARQMLMYRAASFWTSVHAPEISMGFPTQEEVQDTINIDYEDVTPPATKPLGFTDSKSSDRPQGMGATAPPQEMTEAPNVSETPAPVEQPTPKPEFG